MPSLVRPDRRCPKCDSPKYAFRARKTVESPDGTQEVETKYRCSGCDAVWKERVPAPAKPATGEGNAA
ncbi:MAG: hypothetical protein K8U57_04475 [Planctomycetes bacterium]|nr:hypothetical protein [Planctomycetota bacterium]